MAGIDRLEPDIAWSKAKIIVEYDSKASIIKKREYRMTHGAKMPSRLRASKS